MVVDAPANVEELIFGLLVRKQLIEGQFQQGFESFQLCQGTEFVVDGMSDDVLEELAGLDITGLEDLGQRVWVCQGQEAQSAEKGEILAQFGGKYKRVGLVRFCVGILGRLEGFNEKDESRDFVIPFFRRFCQVRLLQSCQD